MLSVIIGSMALGRIWLGLAPFVAAGPSARWMGFPEQHDNPTSRLMGRLFGVRDIGLGVLVFHGLQHPESLGFFLLFNAATDVGDLVAISIPLIKRQGIDRAALTSAAFAFPAAIGWVAMWVLRIG